MGRSTPAEFNAGSDEDADVRHYPVSDVPDEDA